MCMKTYIDRHSHTLHVPRPQVSAQLWGAVIDCINSWGASSEIKKKRSRSERGDSDLQGVIEVHGNYLCTGGGTKWIKLIYETYTEQKKKHRMISISIFYIYCNFMHYKTGKSYRPVSVFCFLGFNFFLISKNFLDTIQIHILQIILHST